MDADLDVEIKGYLDAIGFQTRFALNVDADVRSDVALLRWARENEYILVSHDKYKDASTRLELYPELNSNGGRILRITGDSSQDVLTAAGKIIVNREKWREWFKNNDGIVILKAERVIYRPAEQLFRMVQKRYETDDLARRLRVRKPARSGNRPARKAPNRGDLQMDLRLDDKDSLGRSV